MKSKREEQNKKKIWLLQFHGNLFSYSWVVTCRQTDRGKLIGKFLLFQLADMPTNRLTCWTPMVSAKSSVGFHRPRSLVANEWVCRGLLLRRPPDEDEGLVALRRGWRFSGSVRGVITEGNDATTLTDDPSSAKHHHNRSINTTFRITIKQTTFNFLIPCLMESTTASLLHTVQCTSDYTHKNKCKQLFDKCGQFYYTWSTKQTAVAYKKYHHCLKSYGWSKMMEFDATLCVNTLFSYLTFHWYLF